MAKIKIDIEKMLQWAYRDELPKQAVGGLTGWERLTFLGTTVDESDREYSLPIALGPPHPDALQLDHAVRLLPTVGVDWARSRRHIMGDLHLWLDDKDLRVSGLSTSAMALVMAHAKMGTRPHWDMGPVRVRPKRGKNGKPVVQFEDDNGELVDGLTAGKRYGPGARCLTMLDPEPHDIACARFEYGVWRQGLVSLVREGWNYVDHVVTMPAAAEAPWAHDDEKISKVLPSATRFTDDDKLPLKPDRPSVSAPPLRSRRGSEVRVIKKPFTTMA